MALSLASALQYIKRDDKDSAAATTHGKRLARSIADRAGESSFPAKYLATLIASELFEIFNQQDKRGTGCGEQFLEWSLELLYGKIVRQHLETFNMAWEWLSEHDARQDNALTWGDVDCSAWVEKPRDDNRRVLIVECHCACRDDNKHIFIADSISFHMRSAWPRTVRARGLKGSGWTYVDKPSLALYRRQDFACEYGDSRDVGYCGSYEQLTDKVDHAELYVGQIDSALYALRGVIHGIEDPLYLPKSTL